MAGNVKEAAPLKGITFMEKIIEVTGNSCYRIEYIGYIPVRNLRRTFRIKVSLNVYGKVHVLPCPPVHFFKLYVQFKKAVIGI